MTWDSVGVTFTAFKLAVTDTASAAASALMDLLVGGSSVFKVTKGGHAGLPSGTNGAGTLSAFFLNDTNTGFFNDNADEVTFVSGGTITARVNASGVTVSNGSGILTSGSAAWRWASSTRLLTPANGQLRVDGNSDNTAGAMLLLGDATANSVAIKRNTTRVEAKLANDSAYAQLTCEKLGVNNRAAATTLGSVTGKTEVFDAAGASLGFIAIYDAIT